MFGYCSPSLKGVLYIYFFCREFERKVYGVYVEEKGCCLVTKTEQRETSVADLNELTKGYTVSSAIICRNIRCMRKSLWRTGS